MRIVFMGTPDIAADILRRIEPEQEVVGVFCQPDRPVGRKAVLTPPPVKLAAQSCRIPVFQPEKMRDGTAATQIAALRPDVIVVVAYGRILPQEILDIPPCGCVNIHVSLLPKYRGAAPIQHALLNGEQETGVTAMFMDAGLDTGDIIEQRAFPISEADDAESIFERSALLGGDLLSDTLRAIDDGTVLRKQQNDDLASFAPPINKEMAFFTFNDCAANIVNRVRAFCIWPVARFVREGRNVQVLRARYLNATAKAGTVLALEPLTVAAIDGAVELLEVKPENGRAMSGHEFAMGLRLKIGDFLCF